VTQGAVCDAGGHEVTTIEGVTGPGSDLHATAAYRTDVAGTLAGRALEIAARTASSRGLA
jgi:CO/xanthine dehydrogenase FAD-binding subunit